MMAGPGRLPSRFGLVVAALTVLGFATAAWAAEGDKPSPEVEREQARLFKIPNAQMQLMAWSSLEGWAEDDHAAAFATFMKSCNAILGGPPGQRAARPMYGALRDVCVRAIAKRPSNAGEARAFFEQNFRPVHISPLGESDGFLTGYYEPIVDGSRERNEEFIHPLYRKPAGLLAGGRMAAKTVVTGVKKGKSKRVRKAKFVPFYDRTAIENGAIAGRNLEICYLKDPIDAFFVEIQGSARVRMPDGSLLRVNYAAQNGHKYFAVGKVLVDRNVFTREEMSMQRIRQWMVENPEEGQKLRRMNKSVVFFRETTLADHEEAAGAQGVSLTPGRSIAVDRKLHVYGTPFFITGSLPIESEQPTTVFRRLLIAQDTGGAIVGPARADIYFGAGDGPADIAGRMKHPGKFVMLVPNELDPALRHVPLPLPRPAIVVATAKSDTVTPATVASKPDAKPVTTSEAQRTRTKVQRTRKPGVKAQPAEKSLWAKLTDAMKGTEKKTASKKPVSRNPSVRKADGKAKAKSKHKT